MVLLHLNAIIIIESLVLVSVRLAEIPVVRITILYNVSSCQLSLSFCSSLRNFYKLPNSSITCKRKRSAI